MAEIKFTGFVDDWTKNSAQHPDWAMKVSEPHKKKEGDNWVVVGRTYRTVKAAYGVTIDFTQFPTNAMVTVIGKEVTETSERDGKTYNNLVVKAESVTLEASIKKSPTVANPVQFIDNAADILNAPF